jgi:hypothetical protein
MGSKYQQKFCTHSLRDARLAPFAGDPLKGRFRVVGHRRFLLCQLGQGARDLRVAVFNHHA